MILKVASKCAGSLADFAFQVLSRRSCQNEWRQKKTPATFHTVSYLKAAGLQALEDMGVLKIEVEGMLLQNEYIV